MLQQGLFPNRNLRKRIEEYEDEVLKAAECAVEKERQLVAAAVARAGGGVAGRADDESMPDAPSPLLQPGQAAAATRAELAEQMVDMGFGRAEAEGALELCSGDFDDAIEALTRPVQPRTVPFGTAAPGRLDQQSLGAQRPARGWRRRGESGDGVESEDGVESQDDGVEKEVDSEDEPIAGLAAPPPASRRPLASLSPPAATKRKAAAPCSSPSSSKKLGMARSRTTAFL